MGGFGSGRQGGGPTVEDGLRLDINDLLRKKIIEPGRRVGGSLKWTNTATGEERASMGFEVSLVDADDAWARLRYAVNGVAQDYRVQITTSACQYGGVRWWWRCPLSGRRAAKLYLPPGALQFAARNAYRLAYRSQRVTALDRSHERQRRLYRKLLTEYAFFEQPSPRRPKGMHHRTYARLASELDEAMWLHNRLFEAAVAPLIARAFPDLLGAPTAALQLRARYLQCAVDGNYQTIESVHFRRGQQTAPASQWRTKVSLRPSMDNFRQQRTASIAPAMIGGRSFEKAGRRPA